MPHTKLGCGLNSGLKFLWNLMCIQAEFGSNGGCDYGEERFLFTTRVYVVDYDVAAIVINKEDWVV